ncbi:MAG: L,D-transpeptidase [Candidatus Zixiibacteriota bacterium]
MKKIGFLSLVVVMMAASWWHNKISCRSPRIGAAGVVDSTYEGGTFLAGSQPSDSLVEISQPTIPRRPRGPYIVIDRYCNRLFLRTNDSVILDARCSTGSDGELLDSLTGRKWQFSTPAGVFVVTSKLQNPWWRKPDWAYIEEGISVPDNDADRLDAEMLGDYAIGFGDGYFIHGTLYERLLGVAVTHGCVRMGAEDLEKLYENTRMGTLIYVY